MLFKGKSEGAAERGDGCGDDEKDWRDGVQAGQKTGDGVVKHEKKFRM